MLEQNKKKLYTNSKKTPKTSILSLKNAFFWQIVWSNQLLAIILQRQNKTMRI